MDTHWIEDRIVELIVKQLKFKLPGADAATFDKTIDLFDKLGIDSIDMAAVALRIQDEFGIDVQEEDYDTFTNVKSMAAFVQQRVALRPNNRASEVSNANQ